MKNFKKFINEDYISGEVVEEGFGHTAKSLAMATMLGLGATLGSTEAGTTQKQQPQITQTFAKIDLNKLRNAIKSVETSGKKNPDRAKGDDGRAFGRYQIHDAAVLDVNRVFKTNYQHEDLFDPKKAEDVFNKYLTFYGKQYTKRTGRQPTYEVLAKIWNGGPLGYKPSNKDTERYWQKVKKHLYRDTLLAKN